MSVYMFARLLGEVRFDHQDCISKEIEEKQPFPPQNPYSQSAGYTGLLYSQHEILGLQMGLDYSYSQPSQDETFGGAETDSEYNEVESLIQQDQAQLREALIHQQEALIEQDQAPAFVYPPQPEVEFGFPQICYCGSEPKIATSSIEPGRRYYTCRNANDGECHV
ncbi:hypothetical protein IGI04_015952 [Brassica rapa subsp. trilocularis]|uniref:Zinc finger GRF-type domain-containing protein n=1 Tax=Brassica rapa subsp. trilocularis TaxID=1813537 RepID=A0ABQ7MRZ7_BRACM|nr:hypothetical protein IGI04_015952 [Brassica rapa subsp. trilocularis]